LASVLDWQLIGRGKSELLPPPWRTVRNPPLQQDLRHALRHASFPEPQRTKIRPAHHPTSSASRATLSSKVTEPFCRLPLHTFCPKLEALNLEHLLRFVERLDWKLTLSLQFSWGTRRAGGRKNGFLLFKGSETRSKDNPDSQLA